MRKHDVLSSKMKSFYKTRDRELERILSGRSPAGPGHEEVHRVVEELRAAFPPEAIPGHLEATHVAAMMEQARSPHRLPDPATGPDEASPVVSLFAGPRRLSTLVASHSARIVAAAVLVLAVFGGVATAGALPGPLQSAVSRAAGAIGIPIPDGHEVPSAPSLPATDEVPSATSLLPAPGGPAGVGGSGQAGVDGASITPAPALPEATVPATLPVGPPASLPPTVPPDTPAGTVLPTVPATAPPTVPATVPPTTPPTVPPTVPDAPPTSEVMPPPLGPPTGQ